MKKQISLRKKIEILEKYFRLIGEEWRLRPEDKLFTRLARYRNYNSFTFRLHYYHNFKMKIRTVRGSCEDIHLMENNFKEDSDFIKIIDYPTSSVAIFKM